MVGEDPISKEVGRKKRQWIGYVLRKEVNDCAVALACIEVGVEEKQKQTQNYLAVHFGERERQTWMEYMGKSKTHSKQSLLKEDFWALLVCRGRQRVDVQHAFLFSF